MPVVPAIMLRQQTCSCRTSGMVVKVHVAQRLIGETQRHH